MQLEPRYFNGSNPINSNPEGAQSSCIEKASVGVLLFKSTLPFQICKENQFSDSITNLKWYLFLFRGEITKLYYKIEMSIWAAAIAASRLVWNFKALLEDSTSADGGV